MNRTFPLYDLHWQEFEKLVIMICDKILGMGTMNFSKGSDGGRDAKFEGKANKYPCAQTPWEGKFIIQAKHTEKPTAKCSDNDFKTILKQEVEKLKKLIENNEVDYYLLFTNRSLSANINYKLENLLTNNVNIKSAIISNERIQLWLQEYPDICKRLNLDNLLLPLQFYDNDIKAIVIAFSKIKENLSEEIGKQQVNLTHIELTKKNEMNNLSKEYFDFIKSNSMLYFEQIKEFLGSPKNRQLKQDYDNTVSDLQEQIIIKREEYEKFEELIAFIYKYILERNFDELKNMRKLLRVFLHYMYFNCDIGKSENVSTG
ncbi:MAG: restriction endonuclease [Candidatus Magnetoovum sp. WYHC-5]|nr:restriction endonuclease [Candidatus Magnetoovum sp. WYHC-5]